MAKMSYWLNILIIKTQSGIKTMSYSDGGEETYNQLVFEDLQDSEFISLHAEKDLQSTIEDGETRVIKGKNKEDAGQTTRQVTIEKGDDVLNVVKGDINISAGRDNVFDVGQSQTVKVTKDQAITVGENKTTKVTKDHSETIGENQTINITKDQSTTIGENHNVTIGESQTTKATKSIGMMVGSK